MEFKMSYVGIIGVIFGIIALVSVFLGWLTVDIFGETDTASGWELFSDVDGAPDSYFRWFPLLALIMGVIALIVYALEFVGMGNNITRIVGIVLGVLVIVFAYMGYSEMVSTMNDLMPGIDEFIKMAYGLYVAIIAGIGLAIAGVLGFLKVLPE